MITTSEGTEVNITRPYENEGLWIEIEDYGAGQSAAVELSIEEVKQLIEALAKAIKNYEDPK